MLKHRSRQPFRLEQAALYGEGDVESEDLPALEEQWDIRVKVWEYPTLHILYHNEQNTSENCFAVLKSDQGQYAYVKWVQQGLLYSRNHKICLQCDTIYISQMHRCLETCKDCRNPKCTLGRGNPSGMYKGFPCTECNRNFISQECRGFHFGETCRKQRICLECDQSYSYKKDEDHICYMHRCRVCGLDVDEDHQCFMQTVSEETLEAEAPPSEKYIFFDYETCKTEDHKYVVACAVAVVYDSDEMHVFESTDALMDWAVKNYKGYTLLSHNGGRFDMHYIKQWCWSRKMPSRDICTGRKLTESKIQPQKDGSYLLRFIDSYRFIPLALRFFAATFGLEHTKTFFPYKFYTVDKMKYKGPMPGREYFTESGEAFEQWYANFEGKTVDLYEMCVDYCKIDVKVLQQGCLKFRALFMALTQNEIDPFQYLTIASTVMRIYQRFHMPEGVIPLAPPRRDREKRAWWLLQKGQAEVVLERDLTDLTGQHFKPHAIDGHTVYYMHTCIDVGCERCFTQYQTHPKTSAPMIHLAKLWKETRAILQDNGYTVVETTACQVTEVQAEELIPGMLFIEPRDAFYGGRTEPIGLYYKPKENEIIRYADYTSLYPSTQFCEYRGVTPATYHQKRTIAYPVGHPMAIANPRPEDLDSYFGFIHCKVTIPEETFMPVLPVRHEGKLMFMTGTLVGTWTTMQVQKAVSLGATLHEVYHVLHYEESTTEMWKSYVSTFLRLKQQAAGWKALLGPERCEDPQAQADYIAMYLEHQGIQLVPEEITQEKNKGIYYIAKLCLNSLWGKFGQKEIFSQVEDIFEDKRMLEVLHDNTLEISTMDVIEGVTVLSYKKRSEANPMVKNTSVAIAAFTTAHAQLRLFEALEVLGERVLYMDTDSVIYVDDKETPLLQMGSFLGDLTDELDGDSIVEFVCTGPKTYSYRTASGKVSVRTKGFTGGITMDHMRKAVLEGDPSFRVVTQPFQMIIHKDHTISEKQYKPGEGKMFRFTFNKRRVCEVAGNEYGSRPFKRSRSHPNPVQ